MCALSFFEMTDKSLKFATFSMFLHLKSLNQPIITCHFQI